MVSKVVSRNVQGKVSQSGQSAAQAVGDGWQPEIVKLLLVVSSSTGMQRFAVRLVEERSSG